MESLFFENRLIFMDNPNYTGAWLHLQLDQRILRYLERTATNLHYI
jgi:hypothetical protein